MFIQAATRTELETQLKEASLAYIAGEGNYLEVAYLARRLVNLNDKETKETLGL